MVPTLFAKRLAGGPATSIAEQATGGGSSAPASQAGLLDALKAVARDVLRTAASVHGAALAREQEVLILSADMAIAIYAAESASLRAEATAAAGSSAADLQRAAASLAVERAAASVYAAAREAFAALLAGPQLGQALERLERLSRRVPVNTVESGRRIAEATVARGGYLFDYD